MLKKTFLTIWLSAAVLLLNAQETSLFNLNDIWEINKVNPALFPDKKIVIALPSPYLGFYNSAVSFNDILVDKGQGNYTFEADTWFGKLELENELRAEAEVNTLGLQFGMKKWSFGLNHAIKFRTSVDYPKTLGGLLTQGNAYYINEEVEFGPKLSARSYNELGFSVAYDAHDFITVGFRLKYLSGLGDITSEKHSAKIYTDDDIYEITLKTDMVLKTSSFLSYDSLFRVNTDEVFKGNFGSGNSGVAFDFGVDIRPTDKLNIALSLIDVGAINWDQNLKTFTSNEDRLFEATEIDLTTFIEDGTLEVDSENDNLSFDEIFKFRESAAAYKTILPKKLYANVGYELDSLIRVNATWLSDISDGTVRSSFAIGAQVQVLKFLSLGANYGIRNKENNLGVNLLLRFGPVRVFALTDNIVPIFKLYDSKSASLRFGLNLAFGKR